MANLAKQQGWISLTFVSGDCPVSFRMMCHTLSERHVEFLCLKFCGTLCLAISCLLQNNIWHMSHRNRVLAGIAFQIQQQQQLLILPCSSPGLFSSPFSSAFSPEQPRITYLLRQYGSFLTLSLHGSFVPCAGLCCGNQPRSSLFGILVSNCLTNATFYM